MTGMNMDIMDNNILQLQEENNFRMLSINFTRKISETILEYDLSMITASNKPELMLEV
jgi:hypothetical protein